jgi:hypothetical protein
MRCEQSAQHLAGAVQPRLHHGGIGAELARGFLSIQTFDVAEEQNGSASLRQSVDAAADGRPRLLSLNDVRGPFRPRGRLVDLMFVVGEVREQILD